MNNKILAAAVAAALAAPGLAMAQATTSGTSVQIYGLFDQAVRQDKYTAGTVTVGAGAVKDLTQYHLNSGAPNRIGFKGTEALGGGMSAFFQVETQVFTDARVDPAFGSSTNAALGGRPTFFGLRGNWGEVAVGYDDNVFQDVWKQTWSVGPTQGHFGIIMENGNTTGQIPAPLTGTVAGANCAQGAAGALCGISAVGNGTAFFRRVSDSVTYRSPVIYGFKFSTMMEMAELKESQQRTDALNALAPGGFTQYKPAFGSYSLTWHGGPFALAAAYETHVGFRGINTPFTNRNSKDSGFTLGGRYNYGRGLIGVGWERLKYDNSNTAALDNSFELKNWTVQGTFDVTPADVAALGYSHTPGASSCGAGFATDSSAAVVAGTQASGTLSGTNAGLAGSAACGNAGNAKMWTLTWDHNFSKRTAVYAQYSKIDNGAGSTYYYIAGPTTNSGNGTSGAMAPGVDVTTYGIGLKHTF